MRGMVIIAVVCIICAAGPAAVGPVRSITTCDAANPYDDAPDHVALQACLDDYDTVLLQPNQRPGYVGYLIGDTIKVKRTGALLTSAAIPNKATVLAAPELASSMLRALGVDGFEISFIRFDGNRENRAGRDKPCTPSRNSRNVELMGDGFNIRYVESAGALCGSAMTVGDSSDFTIYGSLFYDNGRQPEDANGISG